jgi:hypothetical protein
LIAQGLSVMAIVPVLGTAAAAVALTAVDSLLLIVIFGRETRGRDLRVLEGEHSAHAYRWQTRGLCYPIGNELRPWFAASAMRHSADL